jgi:hypothetical protein
MDYVGQGKVDMEMSDVDKQVNEIMKTWDEEEKQEPVTEIKKSDIEGLDDIRIIAPGQVVMTGMILL